MRMAMSAAAFAVAALLSPALAEDGQWAELTSLPKGMNVAPGVNLSVLGIEPGMGIDDVRAITAGLMTEHVAGPERSEAEKFADKYAGVDQSPPLQEYDSGFMRTTSGGDQIKLGYVGRIELKRDLGIGGRIDDNLLIDLSAPSSGNQVVGVIRHIQYYNETDQPRIAPMVTELKGRFGEPMMRQNGPSLLYRWQFDAGTAIHRDPFDEYDCWPYIGNVTGEGEIDQINTRSGGDCDVVLDVLLHTGISDDHAGAITFTLSDNERGRANMITDFGYFDTYVETYQQGIGGEAPKL